MAYQADRPEIAPEENLSLAAALRDLLRHRELVALWTAREIKVRYTQSALGVAWAVLQPLSLTIIYTIVFSFFVRIPSDGMPYVLFSYTALLPWTFLASALTFGIPSVVNNMNLVTKVYFPREVFPLAAVGASLVDFAVASAVFLLLLVYYGVQLHSSCVWLPLLLLVQLALATGVILLASAVNVFYRDLRFVIPLATQLWLYATPVIYPLAVVPPNLRPLYTLNPMVGIIDGYRAVLLHGQSPYLPYLTISGAISAGLLVLGFLVFKRVEPVFADVI